MKFLIIAFIFYLIFLPSCYAARVDGPYEGRIIDAETGQPIEGVVVLGVWSREYIGPGGAVHSYYDAMETVTDKNGDFKIKGLGLLVVSNVIPMDFLIFKAGYEYLGLWPWASLKVDILLKKKIRWEGEKAIIPLKKLTMEGRQDSATFPHHPEVPEEKIKMMMEEIRKERKERGLD